MEDRVKKYTDILSQMIRCKTISSSEQEDFTAFEEFQNLLKKLFPCLFETASLELIDNCIILKWKGSSDKNPALFMNHHDVVPANGTWKYDPFKGEVAEGKLWGRGTLDTKGGLFGMLMAAEELIEKGFVPSRDIYFESSCCEEVDTIERGCKRIANIFKQRGLFFDFVLDEGGMIVYDPIGGSKGYFAMVGVGEKGCADLKFVACSSGGHASTPGRNTPLVRLGKFMAEAEKGKIFKTSLSDVTCQMFKRISKTMTGYMKILLGHPKLFKGLLEKVMPSVSSNANAMLKTTIAFTVAQGSEAYNVLPQSAYVVGNMRFSHHQGQKDSISKITELAKKYDIETEIIDAGVQSKISPYDNDGFKLIEKAVSTCFENVSTSPYIQTGASDSRFMSLVSDNVYRFVPFVISDQQLSSVHASNENVDISTLEPAVDFYKYLMENI